MEPSRFDALVRALDRTLSRRGALAAMLAAVSAVPPSALAADEKGRRGRGTGSRRGGNGRGGKGTPGAAAGARQGQQGKAQAQATPDRCFSDGACRPGPGANLARCDFGGTAVLANGACDGCNLSRANVRGADLSGANLGGANLGRACLVDADLTGADLHGAQLGGAIFCRTRMPDGTINDDGCGKATPCCPTCTEAGQPCGPGIAGSCCGQGPCVDGVCECPPPLNNCNGTCLTCCPGLPCTPPTSCDPATKQWTHRTNFGGSGFGPGNFGQPRGVAVSGDGQSVWVTDAGFNRLSVWTESGDDWIHQTTFGNRGNGLSQFHNALGVAVSADGQTAWVADTDNHRISVWAKSGNTWVSQTTFGSLGSDADRFHFPSGVAVSDDGQAAWVADSHNHRVSIWTKAGTGWTNLTTFGSKGSGSSQFNLPSGVAVSADGLAVWVADQGNDRVSVWRKSGSEWFPQTSFGSRGSRPNQFNNPFGVAVGTDEQTVWVADIGNDRISVWTRSGSDWTNQSTFGSRGNDLGQFRSPTGVAVSPDGQTALVSDRFNARISVWALMCPPA